MSDLAATLRRMANDKLLVTIRREILQRLTGDSVVHWVAMCSSEGLCVRARSIDAVERLLRSKLAKRPDWDEQRAGAVLLGFELRDRSPTTHQAIEARSRAVSEATRSADLLVVATRDVVRALLIGNPAMSVRDVAKLLGLKKSLVHKIARECEGASGKERAQLREAERETALEARRNTAPDTSTPASFRGEDFRARYRRRREKIENLWLFGRPVVSALARPKRRSNRRR